MEKNDILKAPSGAHFRRADLHIHSWKGSPDVSDAKMTPQGIVDKAIAETLDVIAVTDHNSTTNVARAIAAADAKDLLVIPGVELTTIQGHLLLYFPTVDKLTATFGRLTFSEDGEYCKQSIEDCLDLAQSFDGIGIAAHIESDAGFMARIPGHPPTKAGIMRHPALYALEILDLASRDVYTISDDDEERRSVAHERRKALSAQECLPKVISSDAHEYDRIGKNAKGLQHVTRLKMDALTFEAFRIALSDGSVRCRLEDEVPARVPRILGVGFQGGFLDGQVVHFNKNLTCVIGGRGSGKSSILEGVRAASGQSTKSSVVDSEVWPDTVSLLYEDELGEVQEFVRNRDSSAFNASQPDGISRIPLEGFGQGETAETIQHCGKDPGVLLRFLDRFLDTRDDERADDLNVSKLKKVSAKNTSMKKDVQSLPHYRELAKDTRRKLTKLEREKASEVIRLESALAQERVWHQELEDLLVSLSSPETSDVTELVTYLKEIEGSSPIVGKKTIAGILTVAETFASETEQRRAEWKQKVAAFTSDARKGLAEWKAAETAERKKIDAKRKELEEAGIKLDIDYIRNLSKSLAEYDKRIRELEVKQKELLKAEREHTKLVRERRDGKAALAAKRTALGTHLTRCLSNVEDFKVTLRYKEGAYSPDAQRIVTDAMQWRTSRIPRARLLVEQLTVPGILDAIEARDSDAFGKVLDENHAPLFSKADQQALLSALSAPSFRAKLQTCSYDDLPKITVRGEAVLRGGQTKEIFKDFANLSLGQQQAVILSMLLYSDGTAPLIIDQPEDNLDGLFVANILVPHLRKIKERRQVIIATHNANIAVLSDSELIVPLRATNDKARIDDAGSIDVAATQRHICRILEGGEPAFRRRSKVYGLK